MKPSTEKKKTNGATTKTTKTSARSLLVLDAENTTVAVHVDDTWIDPRGRLLTDEDVRSLQAFAHGETRDLRLNDRAIPSPRLYQRWPHIQHSPSQIQVAAIHACDALDDLHSRLETIELALRASPDGEELAYVRNDLSQASGELYEIRKRLGDAHDADHLKGGA